MSKKPRTQMPAATPIVPGSLKPGVVKQEWEEERANECTKLTKTSRDAVRGGTNRDRENLGGIQECGDVGAKLGEEVG